jgi:hypothetical protein
MSDANSQRTNFATYISRIEDSYLSNQIRCPWIVLSGSVKKVGDRFIRWVIEIQLLAVESS